MEDGTIPGKSGPLPACAGTDLDTWFPGDTQARHSSELDAAKRVCAGCELQPACLQWALLHEEYGLWAGTTQTERARMRREQVITFQPLTFAEMYGRADKGTAREDDAA